jgi:hypothetical protein
MKFLVTLIFLLALIIDPTRIGKINSLKSEAKKAYLAGDFKTAIQKYRYLVDSLQVQEDEVLLNLANSYFQLNDTTNAGAEYQTLTQSSKNQLRSKAQQQLGVMSNKQGKSEEALDHFKQAIKSDPTNADARYNYELLKKKLEEKKKQEQQKKDQNKEQNKDQEKDQEKKDQQDKQKQDQKKEQDKNKEEQNKEQEKKEQEKKDSEQKKKDQEKQEQEQNKEQKEDQEKKEKQNFDPEKMQQMKLSEEKAKMILEAMRNQEKQYLQQNKRKATKPKDKGKPDW